MKFFILLCALGLASQTSWAANRHVASSGVCVKTPTIECEPGYETSQNAKGCFVCTPTESEKEPTCIKAPTIECAQGFHVAEDHKGCFHCVK
jgi:hypothetical protein